MCHVDQCKHEHAKTVCSATGAETLEWYADLAAWDASAHLLLRCTASCHMAPVTAFHAPSKDGAYAAQVAELAYLSIPSISVGVLAGSTNGTKLPTTMHGACHLLHSTAHHGAA